MQLQELGEEALEERLQSATKAPARPANRLVQLIADTVPTGRTVLALELARGEAAKSSAELRQIAEAAVAAGADALVVKTDSEDTPQPLADLMAVVQAAAAAGSRGRRAAAGAAALAPAAPPPVLQRDWCGAELQGATAAGQPPGRCMICRCTISLQLLLLPARAGSCTPGR